MIITTTQTIENDKIEKYLGIVSGAHSYLIGGIIGEGLMMANRLHINALEIATEKMEQQAVELGADAIISVSTNITALGNSNHMIVAVTGTAVQTTAMTALRREKEEKERQERAEKERQEKAQKEKERKQREQDLFALLRN